MATANNPLSSLNTAQNAPSLPWVNNVSTLGVNPYTSYNLYKFPIDIIDNKRHGNNFCVFYVNVRDRSKAFTSGNNQTVQTTTGVPRSQQGTVGTRLASSGNMNFLGGAVSNLKRTNTAICTYMPHNITLNHSMTYESPKLGFFGSLAANGAPSLSELMVQGANTLFDTSGAILKLFGAVAGGPFGKVLSDAGSNIPTTVAKNIASSVSGITLNPHVEVLFKGVKHREFKFTYEFYPKSEAESMQVRELINLFRFHMHPELLDPTGAASSFIFPSEFDIYFYHQDLESGFAQDNPWLFIISSCVLKDIKVNYTAPGMFTTHEKGQPVGIQIDLTFQELEILTKERLTELEFRPFSSIPETTVGF